MCEWLTLASALAVDTPRRGPSSAAQGKQAGQARLRSPGTAPPLIHCPLPRRAGAVQRRQSSGARTRGRDDVGSERRVSAVTAEAKTGPQRVRSAAALIRPKRSRYFVAEPMLYRRPANPKPTPHREPRRGGSVFHGAKSAPRPDVVTTAVTWPLFDLHYTLHRHVKAADVGKLTTPVEGDLPGLVGGNGAGVEALAGGRRGVRIRIFVDPLHGVTGCDRQRRGREGCAFDRDGVRLRLSGSPPRRRRWRRWHRDRRSRPRAPPAPGQTSPDGVAAAASSSSSSVFCSLLPERRLQVLGVLEVGDERRPHLDEQRLELGVAGARESASCRRRRARPGDTRPRCRCRPCRTPRPSASSAFATFFSPPAFRLWLVALSCGVTLSLVDELDRLLVDAGVVRDHQLARTSSPRRCWPSLRRACRRRCPPGWRSRRSRRSARR